MERFDSYFSLFWDEKEDAYSTTLYKELLDMSWRADEVFIEEDIVNWNKIDSAARESILRSLMVTNAVKQSLGCVYLPILNTSMSLEYVNRRALISLIESKLNGEHAQLTSNMIDVLSTKSLTEKIQYEVKARGSIQEVFVLMETAFKSVSGWSNAYESGIPMQDVNVYDELNFSFWQACAVATVALEVSDTVAVGLVAEQSELIELPNIKEGLQLMIEDRSTMSSFFSLLARSKLQLLPKERQEEAITWFTDVVLHVFSGEWYDISSSEYYPLNTVKEIEVYKEYNVNKALVKLNIEPACGSMKMPALIESFLKTDDSYREHLKRKKRPAWLSWKRGGMYE